MTRHPHAGPTRRRVLAGAVATAAAACAPAIVRAQAVRAPKALKIGVFLPRSGYLAPAGQSCYRGALVAPKVLADYGHQMDLVHVDIESNPDVARNQCERVINDGANCIVGAFDFGVHAGDGAGVRAAPGAARRQHRGGSATHRAGLQVSGAQFPDRRPARRQRAWPIKEFIAATKVEPKTAVFLHANDTFGTAQRQAMDKLVPTAGLPFRILEIDRLRSARRRTSSVEVTKIRSLNPDLVLVVTRSADAIKLVRDMVRQRFEPKGIISPGSPGLYDEEFYQALGPLADYHAYPISMGQSEGRHDAGAGERRSSRPTRTCASRSNASMSASRSRPC